MPATRDTTKSHVRGDIGAVFIEDPGFCIIISSHRVLFQFCRPGTNKFFSLIVWLVASTQTRNDKKKKKSNDQTLFLHSISISVSTISYFLFSSHRDALVILVVLNLS